MYYIIVNPASKSGRGAKIWSMIEPVLDQKDIKYKVFFSARTGHVAKLVRDLSDSFFTRSPQDVLNFIILGGDGTLNEALQGISRFEQVRIGYIPTGSSNDMARDLNLPEDPIQILENILSCKAPTLMDIGCLVYEQTSEQFSRQHGDNMWTKRYFAVSSGIGFDAAVCEEALTSKMKKGLNKIGLGKLTYLSIALKQLIKAKKITCTITLDDKEKIYIPKFLFVAGMIHQYEGGGFKFCPGADPKDGLIDVCAVGNIPKWLVLLALPTAFKGNHYRFNGIDRYSASRVRLETSSPLWVHTDGEVTMKSSSVTLTCEKQKLWLLL